MFMLVYTTNQDKSILKSNSNRLHSAVLISGSKTQSNPLLPQVSLLAWKSSGSILMQSSPAQNDIGKDQDPSVSMKIRSNI